MTRRTVTFVGELGGGNMGSDASLEVLVEHFRRRHPSVTLVCACWDPDAVRARYAIETTPLHPRHGHGRLPTLLGRVGDVGRYVRLARRSDWVIVPGSGSLEGEAGITLRGRPLLFLQVALACRVTRSRMAYVSVGASPMPSRTLTWVMRRAAALAAYRSYRDSYSKESVQRMGLDTRHDEVFTDLVFALDATQTSLRSEDPAVHSVALGVMAYGGNSHREAERGAAHDTYLTVMSEAVTQLLARGVSVVLTPGDDMDVAVAARLRTMVLAGTGSTDAPLTVAPVGDLADLRRVFSTVDVVIASRYHNLIAGLIEGRPTAALSYSKKSAALLAEAGMPAPRPLADLEPGDLVALFDDLSVNKVELGQRARQTYARLHARALSQLDALDHLPGLSADHERTIAGTAAEHP